MTNLAKFTLSACAAFFLSSSAYSSDDQGFEVTTVPIQRMVEIARDNILATHQQQHWLLQKATQAFTEDLDTSGETLGKELSGRLQRNIEVLENSGITSQKYDDVGIPIKHHKTLIQLKQAKDWVEDQGDNFGSNHFNYLALLGNLAESLPQLSSNPSTSFFGNGNDAVSGVYLYTIVKYYEQKGLLSGLDLSRESFQGAVTFFPYYNSKITFNCEENDFLFPDGMLLAGDYQFGGRRYWSGPLKVGQLAFGPEDCSSAVVKATLNGNDFIRVTTRSFREMYPMPLYGYASITTSKDQDLNLELIQPGDIYVKGGHTALITSIDNYGAAQTVEFNRDIDGGDVMKGKKNPALGGGTFFYDLTVTDKERPIFIFRKPDSQLSESVPLNTLLAQIDGIFVTTHLNEEHRPVLKR